MTAILPFHLRVLAICGLFLMLAAPAHALVLDNTYGLKGAAGGNLWTDPDEDFGDGFGYQGWGGGFAYSVGGYYELRVAKLVALEIDLLWDKGELYRDVDIAGGTIRESVTATNLRIPILAKLTIPMGLSRFSFGLGPEFVRPISVSSEHVTKTGGIALTSEIKAEEAASTMFVMDLGMVFGVGPIEVPLGIRAAKNLTQSNKWSERVSMNGNSYTVKAQNSWDFRLMLGVGLSL